MRPIFSHPVSCDRVSCDRVSFDRVFPRPALGTFVLVLLALGLAACGGGGGKEPFVLDETFPVPEDDGGGGGSTTPPPAPSQEPEWNADAALYGRNALFGAFSSDLVRHGNTLFAVDADAVETSGANILAFDVAGAAPRVSPDFATTTITGEDLVDSAGNAADPTSPIGFGFFLNDVLIVNDHLGFVLVNAGGSDSAPGLSNVVAFDPTTGTIRQTLDLALPYLTSDPITDSTGQAIPGGAFRQSGAEGMAYAGHSESTGRLYVTMSNILFGAPSYGAVKLPGTVQVLDVDTSRTAPLAIARNGPTEPPLVIRTQGYNPVAASVLPVVRAGQAPLFRLLVTVAGTTGYDANFNLVPVTPSKVEAYDGATGGLLGFFQLGLTGLSAIRPALGFDAAGHHVGFFPSSTTGEVYLLRLDGLYADPIETSKLAVLRGPLDGIPITAAQAGGPGGNITGVGLSPDGRTLAVSGFGDLFATPQVPGQLFLLSLPEDLVGDPDFAAGFTPGSTRFATTPGRTLGNVVLVPNGGARPDVFVNVSGTLDALLLGNGGASLGSLRTFGLIK